MIYKIVDGLDLARRDNMRNKKGDLSQREWILSLSLRMSQKNMLDTPYTGKTNGAVEKAVAFVGSGKWSAACPECGENATEYVNVEEKIFYCFNCGNKAIGGDARGVIYPNKPERIKIENALLERPHNTRRGATLLSTVQQATPFYHGMTRDWRPYQTVNDLKKINADNIPKGKGNQVENGRVIKEFGSKR